MTRLSAIQKSEIRERCANLGTAITAATVGNILKNLSKMPRDWKDYIGVIFAVGYGGESAGRAIAEFAIASYENLTGN